MIRLPAALLDRGATTVDGDGTAASDASTARDDDGVVRTRARSVRCRPFGPSSPTGLQAQGVAALEVALDEEVGDNSQVRVVVTPDTGDYAAGACERAETVSTCVASTTADGVEQWLRWEAGAPEEDPGLILVRVRREDRWVSVLHDGSFIRADPRKGAPATLAADLVAPAADPAVGSPSSAASTEAGTAIDDAVVLDHLGQGNGYPPPRRLGG